MEASKFVFLLEVTLITSGNALYWNWTEKGKCICFCPFSAFFFILESILFFQTECLADMTDCHTDLMSIRIGVGGDRLASFHFVSYI